MQPDHPLFTRRTAHFFSIFGHTRTPIHTASNSTTKPQSSAAIPIAAPLHPAVEKTKSAIKIAPTRAGALGANAFSAMLN